MPFDGNDATRWNAAHQDDPSAGGFNYGAPSAFDQALDPFLQALPGVNDQILGMKSLFDPSQYTQQLGALGQQYQGIASGSNNPIFDQYRTSMLNQAQANAQRQLANTSAFFDQQGMGGSGAALNALQRTQAQSDLTQQGITGQLGMDEMNQKLGAMGQLGSLYGQQFSGQMAGGQGQLGVLGAYLQNLSVPAQLQTAQTAAQNAGKTPSVGDGGGGGPFSSILGRL